MRISSAARTSTRPTVRYPGPAPTPGYQKSYFAVSGIVLPTVRLLPRCEGGGERVAFLLLMVHKPLPVWHSRQDGTRRLRQPPPRTRQGEQPQCVMFA